MRGGKADGLRRAEDSERRALTALLDAGRGLADGDATLRKLESTLRAAAVDPEARELLERGRLTKELSASGFGLAGMPAPPKRKTSSEAGKPDAAAERRKRDLDKARSALQEAQKRAQTADREADKARKELLKAEEQLRSLERSNK
jgi:hypothetical protein